MAEPNKHLCDKNEIRWDDKPDHEGCGSISWYGVCEKCGRKVFEVYTQNEELYDSESGDTVDEVVDAIEKSGPEIAGED